MRNFFSLLKIISVIAIAILADSCKKNPSGPSVEPQHVSGAVQKGPFITGTSVTIHPLDARLEPTGESYQTQISDDLGNFMFPAKISAPYAELTAQGYYFNEISGRLSDSPITLRSIIKLSDGDHNINLLTTLEAGRLLHLITNERKSFDGARTTAQNETLACFGITLHNAPASDRMDISQAGKANAALLAVSAIMQGARTEAELTELTANIANDIRDYGQIEQPELQEAVRRSGMAINPDQVRRNLIDRYTALGLPTAAVPDFYDYVDSDGDGQLNGAKPYVILSDNYVQLRSDQEQVVVGIRSNREWETVIPADARSWIRQDAQSTADRLVLSVTPNHDGVRSARIVVGHKTGSAAETLTVVQSGTYIIFNVELTSQNSYAPLLADEIADLVLIGFNSQGEMIFNKSIDRITETAFTLSVKPKQERLDDKAITLYTIANDFGTYKDFQGTETELKALRTTQDLNRITTPMPRVTTQQCYQLHEPNNKVIIPLEYAVAKINLDIRINEETFDSPAAVRQVMLEGINSVSGLLFPDSEAIDTSFRNDLTLLPTDDNKYIVYVYPNSSINTIQITVRYNGRDETYTVSAESLKKIWTFFRAGVSYPLTLYINKKTENKALSFSAE